MDQVPKRPNVEDAHSYLHAMVWDRVFGGRDFLIAGAGIRISITPQGQYVIESIIRGGSSFTGGYRGEYDETKSYAAGETFDVTRTLVLDGITVAKGYYGVPPAGTDSAGKTFAGNVPANPTGNAVPQWPLPSSGMLYAKPIKIDC